MFALSLVAELFGALYTIAVARGKLKWAIFASLICSILSVTWLAGMVYNPQTFPAVITGETIGTIVAMKLTMKRQLA